MAQSKELQIEMIPLRYAAAVPLIEPEVIEHYEAVRKAAMVFEQTIIEHCPQTADKLFSGAGLSAGGVAVYEIFEFVKANPTASIGLIKEFGPIFVLAVILVGLVNRLIGVMEKSATSSQEMADAMRQIADKDDRQAERMELLTQYSAQTATDVSGSLSKFADTLDSHTKTMGLQNSALDRIEKRQESMQTKLDGLEHLPSTYETFDVLYKSMQTKLDGLEHMQRIPTPAEETAPKGHIT